MRRLLWTMIAVAGLSFAQEDPNKTVRKIIDVKYADPQVIANLVNGPGIDLKSDRSLHVLIVRGSAATVAEVEAMVRKLDTAPPNIELIVYLVSGSSRDSVDDLPKDLAPTAKQLHGLFAYKSYHVMQSFILRSRDGRDANDKGTLPNTNSDYSFQYRSATVSQTTPRVVHIDQMQFQVTTPTGEKNNNGSPALRYANIPSDIDIGEGQKVVVGKSSTNATDEALILVVTAKVVE
jgi:hypothetical protein